MDGVVEIPLTKGMVAIVDEADAEIIGRYKWHAAACGTSTFYAATKVQRGGEIKRILMHRLITGATTGQVVDHISGNGLDNRRPNLRITNAQGNAWNHGAQRGAKSQYRGVSFYESMFYVRIFVNGCNQYLGRYTDERLAARVFDFAAAQHFGEFARLNLPDEPPLTEAEFAALSSRKPTTSSYRGVSWRKDRGRWRAYIQVDGALKHVGHFTDEIEAARAYNEAAVKYHGDKAVLNEV